MNYSWFRFGDLPIGLYATTKYNRRIVSENLRNGLCLDVAVFLDTTANDGSGGPGGPFSTTSRRFACEPVGVEDGGRSLVGQFAFDVR